jgi:hypothetical protein
MRPVSGSAYGNQSLCCWPDCYEPAERDNTPICETHLRQAGMAWLADNIELVREVTGVASQEIMFDRVRRDTEFRRPAREALLAQQAAEREAGAIVYYLRIGDRIKIGFTTNLKQRLSNLRLDPGCVLATEPGGREVEWARHQDFADERYGRREDFAPSDRLIEHIERLRGTPV